MCIQFCIGFIDFMLKDKSLLLEYTNLFPPNVSRQKKSAIENGTEATLNLSANIISDSNDEINFPQKVVLLDKHVSKPFKAFSDG